MVTVLKFPVYVEITSDNIDRKVISDGANSILYPHFVSYLGNAKFRSKILEQFRESTKVKNLDIKILTEIDLFKNRSTTISETHVE